MAIPEEQLRIWSAIGAQATSKGTRATIKAALEHPDAPFAKRDFEVFLQGSYGNDTNVRIDSDVDIVIKTNSIYHYDVDALPTVDKQRFANGFVAATYLYADFKGEVTDWLRMRFETDCVPGTKAVTIAARGNRRKADVLIANEFRLYRPSSSFMPLSYASGIRFVTTEGVAIVNFPKQHSENLTVRHQLTGNLKPVIRVFKNLRNRMVDDGVIERALAPSYFIEGMLYNVPPDYFTSSLQNAVSGSLVWLWSTAKSDALVCANGIHPLLGDTPTSWPQADIARFVQSAADVWDHW